MDRWEYAVLSAFGVVAIVVGALTTTEPLGEFLVSGVTETVGTALSMVWITWWALVVGFAIAGGVEAWISGDRISDLLEGNGPREIAYGSFFGFVSSSCSYSAIATAKNLFKKGASASAALAAFMFASTNLVIEIGAIIWLLLGWQFLLADFLGGLLLIVLMALGFVFLVPEEIIETARENATDDADSLVVDPVCGMEVDPEETEHTIEHGGRTYYFCSASCKSSFDPEADTDSIRERATSLEGWKALADKQFSEWGMLYEDIAVGFVFAGILAGFVPDSVWTSLFAGDLLGGPAFVLWTAILGAVIGILTFVCSVGNVPFATILWTRGLPFGGILSYIFADLIIPPIMDAYREYYGTTFAAILSAMIFVGAVLSGIVMYVLFAGLGLIPPRSSATIETISVGLDYKAVLNVLATVLFLVLYYLHRTSTMDTSGDGESKTAAD